MCEVECVPPIAKNKCTQTITKKKIVVVVVRQKRGPNICGWTEGLEGVKHPSDTPGCVCTVTTHALPSGHPA